MEKKIVKNLLHKELSYQIHGAAIEVRKDFGSGHKEKLYQEAFVQELKRRDVNFDKEKAVKIFSPKDGQYVGLYRPDFIVEDKIVVELKVVEKIPKMFLDQLFSYLKNSKYELGYFINFASPKLYIKRLIFTNDRKTFDNMPKDSNIKPKVAKFLLVSISFLLVFFSVWPEAQAAEFKITTPKPTINTQQRVKVEVWLNGQGEPINAVEGKIIWPKDYFSLESASDANSIINFWITKPGVDADGYLAFAGIIPGGYTESGGLLFTAILQAKRDGEASLFFKDVKALLNDGQGTPAKIVIVPLKLRIATSTPLLLDFPNPDNARPEDFKPEVSSSPDLFDNQYFMVFASQDKGSGLDYYEVVESRRELEARKIEPGLWARAESPYLLKDQKLASYIYVKAVDKAGNERLVSVSPIKPRFSLWPQLPQILFYGIIIALIILGGIAIKSVRLNVVIRQKEHANKEGKKFR